MSTRITMPTEEQLAPGPLRELISGLHRLYMDAGAPSSRQVSAAIEKDDDARGKPSHETVSALLRRPGQVPRWENVQSVVRTLASWSHRRPDVDAEVSRFHPLWQAAELAAGAAEGEIGTSWHVDPADYIRPLPKAMAAQTEPHSFVALLEQMDNEGQDRLLPPLAAALWKPPQSAKYCIEVMDEFRSAGRSKPAHAVLVAGALSYQFRELAAELRALGRPEADQVDETAHLYMPLPYVWEQVWSLAPKSGGTAPARLLFEHMTRRRDPSEVVSFLTSDEFLTAPGEDREELADIFLSVIATTYGEEQLLELTDHMRDTGLSAKTSRIWRHVAEQRTPLAPMLRALRDNDRSWETTAVLRRMTPQLTPAPYAHDAQACAARIRTVLAELSRAGLYEDAEILLQLLADYYRSLERPHRDRVYTNLLHSYRI
ncbi:hypothetical protein J3A78_000032 [Streptomyces sp. PvR006]|uniref:hypothetical protein n=1 Tax=Streptomyces sp. PvR006 TaxID=2817860 RepID=UPI001AE61487|nr:hypothetical protein [Streptomyces sp. PvR006]MBP2579554.1 hypothetical protein [Streptomyces sp. PvR006]